LPGPAIGIVKVAIEDIARHFIIETHVVVAHHTGLFRGEQRMDAFSELSFDHAATHRYLRGNAGDHYRFGLWQIVIRRTAVEHFGFADRIKLTVGAQAGKLGWPVTRGAGAEGLVIVEEKGRLYEVVFQCALPFVIVH